MLGETDVLHTALSIIQGVAVKCNRPFYRLVLSMNGSIFALDVLIVDVFLVLLCCLF